MKPASHMSIRPLYWLIFSFILVIFLTILLCDAFWLTRHATQATTVSARKQNVTSWNSESSTISIEPDRWTQIIIRTASRTMYKGRMNKVHCLNDRPCVSVKVNSVKVFRAYWRQWSLGLRLSGLSISVTSKNGETIIDKERSVHAPMSMVETLALLYLYPISTNMPANARITT